MSLRAVLLCAALGSASASCLAHRARADAGLACALETPLSRAAAELLASGETPSSERLARAVRDAGSDAVGVRALYTPTDDAEMQRRWLDELRRRADAPAVCGHAVGTDGALLLAAARGGSLEPLGAESIRVRGSLARGFTDPEIVASDANAGLVRVRVDPTSLARGIPVSTELERPARVQLVARGPSGPRPVAERVLPAPDAPPLPDAEPIASEPGAPIHAQLDGLRMAHGQRPLLQNRLVDEVAASHAARVCETGRVAHTLDARDPEQRLARAGLRARVVGEAVARAASVDAAFVAMQRSPAHRMTLLDRRFTHVGTGNVRDPRGGVCLVVLLAAWPDFVGR